MAKIQQKKSAILNAKVDPDLKFRAIESYKLARTNLAYSVLKQGCKKIVFTSCLPGEGKTTTSANMANSLAMQVDVKVLLVDCDLRKPKVNRFFNLKLSPGLTDYLVGMNRLDEIIQKTENPNLSVISSGTIVPNPSEMLACEAMAELLKRIENDYDYIIIDTPPVNIVVDALAAAKIADGVIIVVKEGSSTYPELNKCIQSFERVEAKILGFILNGSKMMTKGNYKYNYEDYE